MPRAHQPGQSVFRSILPEDINWQPFPAFPPAARLAVLIGHPSERGPYVIRVKVPAGTKLMPHRHPEDRIYTVMSGVFYIGLGDQFDGDKVKAFPARKRDRSAGRHVTFPLGQIRRIRHGSLGNRPARPGIFGSSRRPAPALRTVLGRLKAL